MDDYDEEELDRLAAERAEAWLAKNAQQHTPRAPRDYGRKRVLPRKRVSVPIVPDTTASQRNARSDNLSIARGRAQELRAQGFIVGGRKKAICPHCPEYAAKLHYCAHRLETRQDDTRCKCCPKCEFECETAGGFARDDNEN